MLWVLLLLLVPFLSLLLYYVDEQALGRDRNARSWIINVTNI